MRGNAVPPHPLPALRAGGRGHQGAAAENRLLARGARGWAGGTATAGGPWCGRRWRTNGGGLLAAPLWRGRGARAWP
jgi:hypothetical protein